MQNNEKDDTHDNIAYILDIFGRGSDSNDVEMQCEAKYTHIERSQWIDMKG